MLGKVTPCAIWVPESWRREERKDRQAGRQTEESWDDVECSCWWSTPTMPTSLFIMYHPQGGVRQSQKKVSVGESSEVVNTQKEEATAASFCTHWSVVYKQTYLNPRGKLYHPLSFVHKANDFASFPGVQGLVLCYACARVNETHSFRTSPTQGLLCFLKRIIVNMTINIHGPLRHCNQDLLPNKLITSFSRALLSSECTAF